MPALRAMTIGGSAGPWEQLGFNVIDNQVRLGRVVLVLTGSSEDRGLLGWSITAVEGHIDGLQSVPLPDPVSSDRITGHHNGVFGIDRVTIFTADITRSAVAFARAGLTERQDGVFWAGRTIIELVPGPESAAPGRCSLGGLTLVCDDFDRTADLLGSALSPHREAAQPGRVVGTVDVSRTGISVPVDIVSPHPDAGIEQFAAAQADR